MSEIGLKPTVNNNFEPGCHFGQNIIKFTDKHYKYWNIHTQTSSMSSFRGTPLIGNKIFVPGHYSHKEVEDPEDEYFMLVDISDAGDGVYYSVTRLVGGKYGRLSTDDDDTLQLDLDEFLLFRGYYMRNG